MKIRVKERFAYAFSNRYAKYLKIDEVVDIKDEDFEMLKAANLVEKFQEKNECSNKMMKLGENKNINSKNKSK